MAKCFVGEVIWLTVCNSLWTSRAPIRSGGSGLVEAGAFVLHVRGELARRLVSGKLVLTRFRPS